MLRFLHRIPGPCLSWLLLLLFAASSSPLHAQTGGDRRGGRLIPSVEEVQDSFDGGHALLIGASKYQHWDDLAGVIPDLVAVRQVLEARGFVVDEEVRDPTYERLISAVRRFILQQGNNPRNRLVIYFAGHGHSMAQSYQGELGFLVPVDAPLPSVDAAGFRAKAVSMVQMRSWAEEIQARHVLFIFDACFAGSVFETFRSAPPDIQRAFNKPTRQFITSGSARETVPDRSLFRRELVSGLEGTADLDNDGFVTGTELGLHLRKRVTSATQHPQFGTQPRPEFREGDFVFWLPENKLEVAPRDRAYLVLNSKPESTIRVNQKRMELFPVKQYVVSQGKQRVRFERDGVAPLEQQLEVRAGQTVRCLARFDVQTVECQTDTMEDTP